MINKSPIDYVNVNSTQFKNKNILITGSTNGIGEKAAITLGKMGSNVYIHGRNKEKGNSIVNKLQKEIGTKSEFFKSDFSNVKEVYATSEMIKEEIDTIDVLINNAGGYFRTDKNATNNIEYTFTVNYLSGFILSQELLPLLDKSKGQSHIVFTSSSAHKAVNDMNLEEVMNNNTNNWKSYSRSKLANVMLSIKLARKLDDENIRTCAVHPGVIPSSKFLRNIFNINKITKYIDYIPLPGISTTNKGAAALINAINSNKNHSGVYYNKFKLESPSEIAQDIDLQDELWNVSVELIK